MENCPGKATRPRFTCRAGLGDGEEAQGCTRLQADTWGLALGAQACWGRPDPGTRAPGHTRAFPGLLSIGWLLRAAPPATHSRSLGPGSSSSLTSVEGAVTWCLSQAGSRVAPVAWPSHRSYLQMGAQVLGPREGNANLPLCPTSARASQGARDRAAGFTFKLKNTE